MYIISVVGSMLPRLHTVTKATLSGFWVSGSAVKPFRAGMLYVIQKMKKRSSQQQPRDKPRTHALRLLLGATLLGVSVVLVFVDDSLESDDRLLDV
jgi:hypothetical protein